MPTRVFTILTLAATAACTSPATQGPPSAPPPTPVALAIARLAPIEDASEYVGTLRSLHSTTIQPQIDGQITDIFVKAGDRVQTGARLFQIDPRRQQAAITSQAAERASREAAVTFARQQAARASGLYAAGAISRQEQEQAETALRTAEGNLKALDAQVVQQEVQLTYFTVIAPTAGSVGDVPVRVGTQVTSQTLLTTIDQNETLELNVPVPIERAPELKRGLPIRILPASGSDPLASTTISFVSPRVDDQTQSVLVKGMLANPDARLRALQNVRARIIWKTSDGLVVPVTAVVRINGIFFAFVAETAGAGLTARQRPIAVGSIVGNDYTILGGIKAGERVVTSGAQKLADGAPISAAQ